LRIDFECRPNGAIIVWSSESPTGDKDCCNVVHVNQNKQNRCADEQPASFGAEEAQQCANHRNQRNSGSQPHGPVLSDETIEIEFGIRVPMDYKHPLVNGLSRIEQNYQQFRQAENYSQRPQDPKTAGASNT
jgi:hypothetical protein